jgi:hypothetical protein
MRVSKLIRTRSDVLSLVLRSAYVNEVFARATQAAEPRDERPRLAPVPDSP